MSSEVRDAVIRGKAKARDSWTTRIKNHVMAKSRKKKIEHFYSLCGDAEAKAVLDVGVSRDNSSLSSQNYFLKTFRYPASYYTGLAVEDISSFAHLYPGRRFVRYSGRRFPFADKAFDWAFSNAVIEHVGDDRRQVEFVDEMLRVAKRVFFTTPNKFFPVESHTHLMFLHWSEQAFYRWCSRHRPWLTKSNLYLFSRRRLEAVMARSRAKHYRIHATSMFGLAMTFTVVCSE